MPKDEAKSHKIPNKGFQEHFQPLSFCWRNALEFCQNFEASYGTCWNGIPLLECQWSLLRPALSSKVYITNLSLFAALIVKQFTSPQVLWSWIKDRNGCTKYRTEHILSSYYLMVLQVWCYRPCYKVRYISWLYGHTLLLGSILQVFLTRQPWNPLKNQ